MGKEKRLFRCNEVVDVPDCSPEDVYNAILRGEVPATKRGKYWLFHYEDVIAYNEIHKRRGKSGKRY